MPADGDGVFGVIVAVSSAVSAEAIGGVEFLFGKRYPLPVDKYFGFIEPRRRPEDLPDADVPVLGDVDVDSGAYGQVVQ